MLDRFTNVVVLVEDIAQQNLIFRFLERCNRSIAYRDCRFEKPAKRSGGSGEQFVRTHYPVEVKENRRRIGRGASALLVAMVDADKNETQVRAKQLSDALDAANLERRGQNDPIVVLIPKRHVETWIRALLGNGVDEVQDYKNPKPTPDEIRQAAVTLHQWTRPNAVPGPTSPPSLTESVPEWRKIPS